jgi:hypothetical protein
MVLDILSPSYIRKRGKDSVHVGKFWRWCSQRMEKGLEAGVFSIVDIDNHTAFHLDTIISPKTVINAMVFGSF